MAKTSGKGRWGSIAAWELDTPREIHLPLPRFVTFEYNLEEWIIESCYLTPASVRYWLDTGRPLE